jgi:predicted Holliday junction resolvase-like endonuclease
MVTIPDGEEKGKMTQISYVNKETGKKKKIHNRCKFWTASIISGLVGLQHCLNKAMLMW